MLRNLTFVHGALRCSTVKLTKRKTNVLSSALKSNSSFSSTTGHTAKQENGQLHMTQNIGKRR
jgi:hypothetical protein